MFKQTKFQHKGAQDQQDSTQTHLCQVNRDCIV